MRCWSLAGAVAAVCAASLTRTTSACNYTAGKPTIRWSSGSDRLYIEGGGCIDLEGVIAERVGPLYHFDKKDNEISQDYTGTFFLNSSLHILDNSTLVVRGEDAGGTANELLLRSNADKYINVRAHGGNLVFDSTKVFSWDPSEGDYDYNTTDGRSYVNAITEVITDSNLTCFGKANVDMGESRMDIYDSEMAYLGWYFKESYGVSWKARGLCADKSNLDVFDTIAVYGNMINSHIHHNYFGHYSYGHQGGNWSGNHVHDNVGYGFDPHDDSDSLTIHNNHVHDNGWHGIIASKRCNNVSIVGNHVHDNGKNGIMLHRSSDYGEIKNNYVHDNGVAGISIHETAYTVVSMNVLEDNGYGIRWNVGSTFTYCVHNVFSQGGGTNMSYPIYFYKGTDAPDIPGNDGRPKYNYVAFNTIYSERDDATKLSEADYNVLEHNLYVTGSRIRFEDVEGNFVYNNTFLEEATSSEEGHFLIQDACFAPGTDAGNNFSVCAF